MAVFFSQTNHNKTPHLLLSAKGAGFTLVEVLVALFMFSLVVGVLFNYLTFSIKDQRTSLGMQRLVEEGSYVAEYMSRALREALKDEDGLCITLGNNYEKIGSALRFIDRDESGNKRCREFRIASGRLQEHLSGDHTSAFGPPISLTSNDIEVTGFHVVLEGESGSSGRQPRVTFSLDMKPVIGEGVTVLQTTISQRNFNSN